MKSGRLETQKHLGCSSFDKTYALTLGKISDFVERTNRQPEFDILPSIVFVALEKKWKLVLESL
jgi:hypothetical protein